MQDIQPAKISNRSKPSPFVPPATAFARDKEKCQILAKKGFLRAKNLTSGVAIVVYSGEYKLGVLLHLGSFSEVDGSRTGRADAFVSSAMAMILAEFEALGVRRKDLITYAIGGSGLDGVPAVSDIKVRRELWNYGLVPVACDLGGEQVRSVWMDVESGRIIVRIEPIVDSICQTKGPVPIAS